MNLGTYRLLTHLRPGHPGAWYEARAEGTDREVRILVCWDPLAESVPWQAVARRLRVLAQLRHPAVVPVLELCLDQQPAFAVFAKPLGTSLADQLKQVGPWPEQTVLEIGCCLSGALAAAHRLGLPHGHLTPAEIWLDDQQGATADFACSVQKAAQKDAGPDAEAGPSARTEINDPTDSLGRASEDILALERVLYRLIYGSKVRSSAGVASARDLDRAVSLPEVLEIMAAHDPDARPSAHEVQCCLARLMGDAAQHRRANVTGVGVQSHGPTRLAPHDPADSPRARPPRQLGRFRLLKKLGEGGLGVVYLGEDSADGKRVAVKTLHAHLTNNEASVRRFRKEARLLAELKSHHVCRLFDFNQDQGTHYLVMELLQGESLGTFLAKYKKFPEPVALALVAKVARGLGEAHRRGIVHRDVKPDNIMLVGPWETLLDGLAAHASAASASSAPALGVKLCDFGLARHVDQSASLALTHTGQFLGTPLYMSPEQAGAGELTARSDVYSLGVTLFQLLTGRPPFQASSVPALYEMHLKADAPSPQDFNTELSAAVCQVVQKTLAKDPQARYADAEELLLDLERMLRGEPTNLVVHPRLPAFAPNELLEYHWTFELDASPEQLWPFISNTERLNHAVGLPGVTYTLDFAAAQDSALPARANRTGSFRKAGVTNTWREHPFEWVEGRRVSVLREYSQGVFKWLASITELQARADGGTTLHHRVRVVPGGLFGRVVAALEVGFKGRQAVEQVYRRIDGYLTRKLPLGPATDPFVPKAAHPVTDQQTAHRLVEQLAARNVAPAVAEDLLDYFLKAPEQEIARIRPLALAQRLRLDPDDVIDACLTAAHEGILVILWDILCPKCRIPAAIEETMRNIRAHGRCPACNLDFDLDFANLVEMVFRVHPSLRASELGVYCVGGPAHSPHVAAQVRVAAAERLELTLSLSEGSYRLRGPQLSYSLDFRVHPEARALRGELQLARGPTLEFPRTFRTGAQTFLLHNDYSDELVVRVERLAARTDALTAARVSALARFRDLFPLEVLSGKQLVSVAHLTLLATDLVGAAEWYQQLGDARMFELLHEHFRILEAHIRRESGAVVKILNEGLLATFHDPAAAVRVALELQTLLEENATTNELRLRVGVHRGSAMVATINGKLDYFGTTVKLALSLPGLAGANEILLTEPLVSDPQVQILLANRRVTCSVRAGQRETPAALPLYSLVSLAQNEPRPRKRPSVSDAKRLAKTPSA